MTRSIALSVMTQEYVTASLALGASFWHLVGRTVLPNCLSVVIVQCSLYFAEVLLAEAALSFLGLGEAPPRPTWGNMLYEAQKYMRNAPLGRDLPGGGDRRLGPRAQPLRRRRPRRDGPPHADLSRCLTCDTLGPVPTKNPRVNVVLERPLYEALARLARRDGTSLSLKARDLLRDALETHEDLALDQVARERERTFDRSRALSHREVWQPAGKPKRR